MSKSKTTKTQPHKEKEQPAHKIRRELNRKLDELVEGSGDPEDWYDEDIQTFQPLPKRKGKP